MHVPFLYEWKARWEIYKFRGGGTLLGGGGGKDLPTHIPKSSSLTDTLAVLTEFQRNCHNRRPTRATEHVCKIIRPSKKVELGSLFRSPYDLTQNISPWIWTSSDRARITHINSTKKPGVCWGGVVLHNNCQNSWGWVASTQVETWQAKALGKILKNSSDIFAGRQWSSDHRQSTTRLLRQLMLSFSQGWRQTPPAK